MSLGLFDVVGPVMHGPSSSHTAGANRIGYLAGRIMGEIPQELSFGFHPLFYKSYVGHCTHIALSAGCLGYREDNAQSVKSWEEARAKGIKISCFDVGDEKVHRNTMIVKGENQEQAWDIHGISLGGGSILIHEINGVKVEVDGNRHLVFLIFAGEEDLARAVEDIKNIPGFVNGYYGRQNQGNWLYCGVFAKEPEIRQDYESLVSIRKIKPLYLFCDQGREPLFTNFTELLHKSEKEPLLSVILEYEAVRSGQQKEVILAEAEKIVQVVKEALAKGFGGSINLIGSLCTGEDGKKLLHYAQSGKTLLGPAFNLALARSVVLAEMNAAAERVVAAPTGGAAGTLPGVLFTAAEILNRDDGAIAEAFLVAAAIGVIIGNRASFSGAVGGCQGEVGIGAAMAAAGAAYLAGADAETVVQAAALTLKNVLGLTCDPPASPVEVPCIKRNAMGAAVAFMGAELALAGVKSVVPPDDVVDALADTQRRLPEELKGSCGGLASTECARSMREKWADKLAAMKENIN